MFSPLPTPKEMTEWDHVTINEIGIRGEILMENAGREAVSALVADYGQIQGERILIIAGSGNNGGDGFVMGRMLADMGADVLVLHTATKNKYKGDAGYHLKIAAKLGVELKYFKNIDEIAMFSADIIIDALLGTGFEGELRPFAQSIVDEINFSDSYVFSIDIPSGLNGVTGRPQPVAVQADATITFEETKLGMAMPAAEMFTGQLFVAAIGIPSIVKDEFPAEHYVINNAVLAPLVSISPVMHKGTSGHVLLVGASKGLTGALHLAGISALRAGAGLVTMACPDGLASEVKGGKPELMTMGLGSGDQWNDQMIAELLSKMDKYDSLVIGPGLGRDKGALDLIEAVVASNHPPAVYDADALYALYKRPHILKNIKENSILTPHPGEMARLISTSISEIESDRVGTAKNFAEKYGVLLTLKGAGTIIGCPDGSAAISPISAPNLAAAGSGDILAGILGALLAKQLNPMQTAATGVYWHGLAGMYLSEKFPYRGNIATEIAEMLPQVLKEELCLKPKTS